MKKSSAVLLSAFFLATTTGCMERREWIAGTDEYAQVPDTVIQDRPYRYYRGAWFRIYPSNMIRVPYYLNHARPHHIARTHHVRTGGFGKMALESPAHS